MGKVILCILDGWGFREATEFNAIKSAKAPNFEYLMANHPFSLLEASGGAVGLPEGQMGNSEVGHITIGAGRAIRQELPKIDHEIATGEFKTNPVLSELITKLKAHKKTCHLIGLVSDGGVHSHIRHIIALATLLKEHKIPVKLHAITDGRDVAPKSALKYLKSIADNDIDIATITGRYYAMDRDKRWERTEAAYDAIVSGKGKPFTDYKALISECYEENITDEFILAHHHKDYHGMKDGDGLIIANFRSDRVRQLATCIIDPQFKEFKTKKLHLANALMMTKYSEDLAKFMPVIFPHEIPEATLGEVIAANNLKQLRAAETEKYAHVTYFFNGGREEPFAGEERILIPSSKVATYDLKPEMSVNEITNAVTQELKKQKHAFVCVNFANADMVGHSGNMPATVKAIEAIDVALGKLMLGAQENGYDLLITADHGNAEEMMDVKTNQPLTSHTLNPVPLIYFGKMKLKLRKGGLADIAPTVLKLLNLPKPDAMKGHELFDLKETGDKNEKAGHSR